MVICNERKEEICKCHVKKFFEMANFARGQMRFSWLPLTTPLCIFDDKSARIPDKLTRERLKIKRKQNTRKKKDENKLC